jgi:predicted lactoylglutathione lyase
MEKMMFTNLPVFNLKRSVDFYTALGFKFNPQFTSETSTCMIVGKYNCIMLLENDTFASFVDKPLAPTKKTVSCIVAITYDSEDEVRAVCEKAFELGARRYKEPEVHGFMFGWGFEDLDGHIIEPFWMDQAEVMTVA